MVLNIYMSQVAVKNLPDNVGEAGAVGFILESGRSPRRGNGSPLHCYCLKNPMDRGAWWAIVRHN